MEFSIGRTVKGPVEELVDCSWEEFVSFMADAQRIAADPGDKLDHFWVGNFLLTAGVGQRRIEDIERHAAWFGIDIDRDNLSVNDLRVKLNGRRWLAYTTASSVPGATRWRVIVALSRGYTIDEHPRIWAWLAAILPMDRPTKNCNRILFLPAAWEGADNLWWAEDGLASDVDTILAMVPPQPEPAAMPHDIPLKQAPNGTPIISDQMIAAVAAAPEGGRLFRLLCGAAKKFRLNGWTLDPADLADAALIAAGQFSPSKKRTHIDREAARAIAWAAHNFQPQSPIERMRQRVLWEDRRFGRR